MMKKRIDKIEIFCKKPIQAQKSIFDFLLLKGKETAFGKEHFFQDIKTYAQFSENIPIRTY